MEASEVSGAFLFGNETIIKKAPNFFKVWGFQVFITTIVLFHIGNNGIAKFRAL